MIGRDELLKIIRMKGPVLPVQIAKEVETTILFASAMLSELVSAKILKVSSVKIGGSPLYYIPEQRSRLQEFSKHLNHKEKEAYELLKTKRVLRDSGQEPAIKVALRNIKDYAWPLSVTVNNSKEIFWKWYLLTNEEAGPMIKGMLGVKKPEKKEEVKEATPVKSPVPEVKKEEVKEEKIERSSKSPNSENLAKPQSKTGEVKQEERIVEEKTKTQQKPLEKPQQISPQNEIQQKIIKEEQNIKRETIKKEERTDSFAEEALAFFSKNNIKIINKELIRKNEIDFIVELQSAVGNLRYYCKAKAKQRIGDGDLSSAYVQGELKKLPVLFLSSGEPTKKAMEMLSKEFQNIVFKKIWRD